VRATSRLFRLTGTSGTHAATQEVFAVRTSPNTKAQRWNARKYALRHSVFALVPRHLERDGCKLHEQKRIGDPSAGARTWDRGRGAFCPVAKPRRQSCQYTTHPRYPYFARAYGLDISSLACEAGAVPTPDQWQSLQARMTETGGRDLIWEARPPEEAITKADQMGLRSVVFAPLAGLPASGDLLEIMRDQISALAKQQSVSM